MRITKIELDLLRRLAQGKSNPQIAAELARHPQTVKNHLVILYAKLAVDNRTQAVLRAINLGLIEIPGENPPIMTTREAT